jgi:hypothetical protein
MTNEISSITEAWLTGRPQLAPRSPAVDRSLRRLAEDFWVLVDTLEAERKAELKATRRRARRAAISSAGAPVDQIAA